MLTLPVRGSKAFTLLELIVVIVILGILAAIAIPTFQKVIEKSKDNSAKQTLMALDREAQALAAFDQVPANSTHYAAAASDLNALQLGVFAAAYTVATSETEAATASKLGLKVADGTVGVSLLSGSGNCVTLRNANGTVSVDVKKIAASTCTGATAWTAPSSAAPAPAPAPTVHGVSETDVTIGSKTVLASALDRPYQLVVHDGFVYSVNRGNAGNPGLFRTPVAGGTTTLVSAIPDSTGLARLGNYFYVVPQSSARLYRVPVAGGPMEEVTSTGLAFIPGNNSLTSDGTALYANGSDVNGQIFRMVPDASGAPQVSRVEIARRSVMLLSLQVDGKGNLYIGRRDGAVERLTLNGDQAATNPVMFPTGATADIWGITLAGGSMYAVDHQGGTVRKIDLASKATSTVISGLNNPVGITTDGTKLFVGEFSANSVSSY